MNLSTDNMENNQRVDITPKDLMTFLEKFRESMEDKIQSTKDTIEGKLDRRLNIVDDEMRKMNTRFDANDVKTDAINERMNERLSALEKEMENSQKIRQRSVALKQKQKDMTSQPGGSRTTKLTPSERTKTVSTPTESTSNFRSSWAQGLQQELEDASAILQPAGRNIREQTKSKKQETHETQYTPLDLTEDTPDCWEQWDSRPNVKIQPAGSKPKIRRPIISTWFGEETSSEESDSNEDSSWSEVERRKKNSDRRRRTKRRKKEKEQRVAMKAASMAGVGPIDMADVNYYLDKGLNFENSKIAALKDYLKQHLGYIDSELDTLSVVETKFAARGEKILYIALSKQEEIRELHIRRAESRNDRLTVRNYIPPSFYERFMSINRLCADARAQDPNLKTQLRFGRQDVELFTKYKGGELGYRLVKLEEFLDTTKIAPFDHKVKWRRVTDQPPRRKVQYNTIRDSDRDPLSNDSPLKQTSDRLTRANSNSTSNVPKKQKIRAESSGEDEVDMDDEDESSGAPADREESI